MRRPVTAAAALFLLSLVSASEEKGCTITAISCKNFPEFRHTHFRDAVGEEMLSAGDNDAACLKRAEDFHYWCGNGVTSGASVAATHNPSKLSQVFHPNACDQGWSQWDAFCYKHFWEKKNWFEAEVLCRDRNSHLASVHSRAENRFIYTLTSGLSAWIGYTDLDQDTHYKWSDNTQDDFSNFAKNCTGRETEPDCKPEEKKQQWYDWDGGDAGTYVCKRNALLPVALLKNVTAKDFTEQPWETLLPTLASLGELDPGTGQKSAAIPELKVGGIAPVSSSTDLATPKLPGVLQPRMGIPKGSLM